MAQQSTGGFGVANVTPLSPESRLNNLPDIKDPVDTLPSEKQPPGVDEEREPQSLEESLLGE